METRPPFDLLAFSILLGLRKGLRYASTLRALAGKDRVAKEAAEQRVAAAVADELRRANLRITEGPPAKGSMDPVPPLVDSAGDGA